MIKDSTLEFLGFRKYITEEDTYYLYIYNNHAFRYYPNKDQLIITYKDQGIVDVVNNINHTELINKLNEQYEK